MTLPPEPLAAFGTHNVLRTPRPESGAARLREEFRATLPTKRLMRLPKLIKDTILQSKSKAGNHKQ